MIVIAGHIRIDPSKRSEAIAAAHAVMEATRQESGCSAYVFSADLADEGVFHVFEHWDSQEALDAHFKAPHMAAFQKAMGGFGVAEMKLLRYDASGARSLFG